MDCHYNLGKTTNQMVAKDFCTVLYILIVYVLIMY